jgi:hypothetical protein
LIDRGSLFTDSFLIDRGSLFTDSFLIDRGSLFTDSLFTDPIGVLPTDDPGRWALLGSLEPIELPYRGGVLALECIDMRLESSDIARAAGESFSWWVPVGSAGP